MAGRKTRETGAHLKTDSGFVFTAGDVSIRARRNQLAPWGAFFISVVGDDVLAQPLTH